MSPTEDLIDPASRLYEIDILILSTYSQSFMDILAEWKKSRSKPYLFERTKEELAMNGGAASYAQHAPSGLSSQMNHLDVDYQKLWLRKQNRFYQTVLILLPRSSPNQCRANGLKGTRQVKNFCSHPDSLNTASEALYMRYFTCVESADFVLPHDPVERESRHLCNHGAQVWFRSTGSKLSAALPSRSQIDLPTATTMKIIIRKRLTKKGFRQLVHM